MTIRLFCKLKYGTVLKTKYVQKYTRVTAYSNVKPELVLKLAPMKLNSKLSYCILFFFHLTL